MDEQLEATARWVCCPMCDRKVCDRTADDCDVKIWINEKLAEKEEQDSLLTSEQRAEVLNIIEKALSSKDCDLTVGGYEDNDGVFFNVLLMKR